MQEGSVCVFHEDTKCRNDQEHREICIRLDALEGRVEANTTRQAVSDEQIKVVFKILNEIKDSITKLTDQMSAAITKLTDEMNNNEKERLTKPVIMMYSIVGTVVSALILSGIAYAAIKGGI